MKKVNSRYRGGVAVDVEENKKRGIRSDCSNTSDNFNNYCLGVGQMAILIQVRICRQ